MIDTYTRLLENVAELDDKAASDAAVTKLIHHLKSSGRIKMLPQIARELRNVAARRRALEPKVEAASEAEAARALACAHAAGIEAKRVRVNHSLIRGWRAWSRGKLVDTSAKRALVEIYTNVVSGS